MIRGRVLKSGENEKGGQGIFELYIIGRGGEGEGGGGVIGGRHGK